FEGTPPQNSRLYWRGPVLTYNDGRKWTRGRVTDTTAPPVETAGDTVKYTITMEATSQRWLFALEMTNQAPENAYIAYDYQLQTRDPVHKRIRYTLTSSPDYTLGR